MAKKAVQETKKPIAPGTTSEFDNTAGVTARIAAMAHPMTPVIEAIREMILQADPEITEGVKWNSPSFYCNGWFATVGGSKPYKLELVFHHGAKVRHETALRQTIDDSGKILRWASSDRAIVTIFVDGDFGTIRPMLKSIASQWAAYQKVLAGKE